MGLAPVFHGHPRQGWQFKVVVDGFDVAYFQKAKIPEVSVEVDEFNTAGSVRSTKFAGRMTVGECTLEKGMNSDQGDMSAWNWLTTAVNSRTGDQGAPGDYRRDIEICHVNRVGDTIQRWVLKEAFCSGISWSDNEGGSSEHVVETLTLTVGDVEVLEA